MLGVPYRKLCTSSIEQIHTSYCLKKLHLPPSHITLIPSIEISPMPIQIDHRSTIPMFLVPVATMSCVRSESNIEPFAIPQTADTVSLFGDMSTVGSLETSANTTVVGEDLVMSFLPGVVHHIGYATCVSAIRHGRGMRCCLKKVPVSNCNHVTGEVELWT